MYAIELSIAAHLPTAPVTIVIVRGRDASPGSERFDSVECAIAAARAFAPDMIVTPC